MSRWRVIPSAADIVVREKEYTAAFDAHNVDSGSVIKIEFTQAIGGPVADLVGALRATAQILIKAATGELDDGAKSEKLN